MKNFAQKLVSALFAVFVFMMPLAASADEVAATGTFIGASDHITTGGVSVIKTANGAAVVILDKNFSLDGAPDPRVGFGKDGVYIEATDLGELKNKDGLQAYVVPANVNVSDFNQVYIWCRKFSVPLGIASIN